MQRFNLTKEFKSVREQFETTMNVRLVDTDYDLESLRVEPSYNGKPTHNMYYKNQQINELFQAFIAGYMYHKNMRK